MTRKRKIRMIQMVLIIGSILVVSCGGYFVWYICRSAQGKANDRKTVAEYVSGQVTIPAHLPQVTSPGTLETGNPNPTDPGEQAPVPTESIPISASDFGISIDFDALSARSKYVCGWLIVPGIQQINYPLVHQDNDFFLNRGWTGDYDARGAIFLERMNGTDFTDLHTVIYGHHMRDGSMFGSLENYKSEEFYREQGGTILVYTPDRLLVYQIFSVEYSSDGTNMVYGREFPTTEMYERFLKEMKQRSLYETSVEVGPSDRILTLSTCAYVFKNARFTVHAKLAYSLPVQE